MSKTRPSDEIHREISELEVKQSTVVDEIARVLAKIKKQRAGHASLLEANVGKKILPKSLETQRGQILTSEVELEALEAAKQNVEKKMRPLQKDLARSQTFENQVQAYLQADASFTQKIDELMDAAVTLQEQIRSFKAVAEEFIENAESPLYLLASFVNDLPGLSLPTFLQGEIAEALLGENDEFIGQISKKYSDHFLQLPKLDDIQTTWQKISDRLSFFSNHANSLLPRYLKYLPPAPEPKREPVVNNVTSIEPPELHPRAMAIRQKQDGEIMKKIEAAKMAEWRRLRSG